MQGIILKRTDYREHDQLITIFTREKGKVCVLARGVKKILSKNSAFLEPFFFVELDFVSGKENKLLTKATGINSFANVRRDLRKAGTAILAAKLLDMFLPENEGDKKIFDFTVRWMEHLDSCGYTESYVLGFLARLSSLIGYAPIFDSCHLCHKALPSSLPDAAAIYFSMSGGGLVCKECLNHAPGMPVVHLRPPELAVWKKLAQGEMNEWPEVVGVKLKEILILFGEYHAGKKLAILGQIL